MTSVSSLLIVMLRPVLCIVLYWSSWRYNVTLQQVVWLGVMSYGHVGTNVDKIKLLVVR